MFISIGPRPQPEDLVGLLLECHERIRSFVRLAKKIGFSDDLQLSDITEACQRCEKYFAEALPLHVEDEEMSLLPRLVGVNPSVDKALQAMRDQHAAHGPYLEPMLRALRALQSEPGSRPERERLRVAATQLTSDFDEHLSLEEEVIFPAIRTALSGDEQVAVIGELRARRR